MRRLSEPEHFIARVAGSEAGEFGVATSSTALDGGTHRLTFAVTSTLGLVRPSRTLDLDTTFLRAAQVVALPDGWALLYRKGLVPVVAFLDRRAALTGPARRLLGASSAFGLARSGDRLAVLAWKKEVADGGGATETAVLRELDVRGVPVGPWRCLAPLAPTVPDFGAAIVGDDKGWLVVRTTASGSVALDRVAKSP